MARKKKAGKKRRKGKFEKSHAHKIKKKNDEKKATESGELRVGGGIAKK